MPAPFYGQRLGCLLLLLCTSLSGGNPTGKCKLSPGRAPCVSGGPEQRLGSKGPPCSGASPRLPGERGAAPARWLHCGLVCVSGCVRSFVSSAAPTPPAPLSVRGSCGTAGSALAVPQPRGGQSRIGHRLSRNLSTHSLTSEGFISSQVQDWEGVVLCLVSVLPLLSRAFKC